MVVAQVPDKQAITGKRLILNDVQLTNLCKLLKDNEANTSTRKRR
jgi:hypothetical protein